MEDFINHGGHGGTRRKKGVNELCELTRKEEFLTAEGAEERGGRRKKKTSRSGAETQRNRKKKRGIELRELTRIIVMKNEKRKMKKV